jgi:hypothetical protein
LWNVKLTIEHDESHQENIHFIFNLIRQVIGNQDTYLMHIFQTTLINDAHGRECQRNPVKPP